MQETKHAPIKNFQIDSGLGDFPYSNGTFDQKLKK